MKFGAEEREVYNEEKEEYDEELEQEKQGDK